MANKKLKIGVLAVLIIVIILGLWDYISSQGQLKKWNKQVALECEAQTLFEIPLVHFYRIASSDTSKIKVIVRRNGKVLTHLLSFYSYDYDKEGDTVGLGLGLFQQNLRADALEDSVKAKSQMNKYTDHQVILKSDTIEISFDNKRYLIHRFASYPMTANHGIMRCAEEYEMNGKTYSSRTGNTINDQNTAN